MASLMASKPRELITERFEKPEPIPTRPNEAWVIEAEPDWWLVHDGRLCDALHGRCSLFAVAARRSGNKVWANCAVHLRKGRMWIENGQVVSWALRPQ